MTSDATDKIVITVGLLVMIFVMTALYVAGYRNGYRKGQLAEDKVFCGVLLDRGFQSAKCEEIIHAQQ